jgi:hypothetical protein
LDLNTIKVVVVEGIRVDVEVEVVSRLVIEDLFLGLFGKGVEDSVVEGLFDVVVEEHFDVGAEELSNEVVEEPILILFEELIVNSLVVAVGVKAVDANESVEDVLNALHFLVLIQWNNYSKLQLVCNAIAIDLTLDILKQMVALKEFQVEEHTQLYILVVLVQQYRVEVLVVVNITVRLDSQNKSVN